MVDSISALSPGTRHHFHWACPRCRTVGVSWVAEHEQTPAYFVSPCCGLPIAIDYHERYAEMATALNAAILTLDGDTRYRIRYGVDPMGEHEAVGYVENGRHNEIEVFHNLKSFNFTTVPRGLIKSITLARAPYTQLYPPVKKEETDAAVSQ